MKGVNRFNPADSPKFPYRRVLVYGVTGAGKTTLAKRIGEKTGLPWHSVDDLTWEPGWVQVPAEEQRRRIQAICEPAWVLDSAYGVWIDLPLGCVDLIVALDYPRWLSLSRLIRRTLVRMVDGKTICNGNRESPKTMFSRESIIGWHFKSFDRKHERIDKWSKDPNGPKVVRIRKPRELEAWVASLGELRSES